MFENLRLLVSAILLFGITYYLSKDITYALHFSIFILGMFIIIYGISNIYIILKKHKFKLKKIIENKSKDNINWRFTLISLIITLLLFIFILPLNFKIIAVTICIICESRVENSKFNVNLICL